MKVERLRFLAAALRKTPFAKPYKKMPDGRNFNMACFYEARGCATVACIAGTAVTIFEPGAVAKLDGARFQSGEAWSIRAALVLGMTPDEARFLFVPHTCLWKSGHKVSLSDIQPAHAAQVLEAVADGAAPLDAWKDCLAGHDPPWWVDGKGDTWM